MRFGVLGPLAAWNDRGEPVAIPGRKVRVLLADLLVHEGRVVSADRLVHDLWDQTPPADPVAALHVRVSQLRRALESVEPGGRDLVVSRSPGYALRALPSSVDALRFAELLDRARAADEARTRAGLLTEALGLWRGPVLADFTDQAFAEAPAARWEERRLTAVETWAEARLELGEHRELIPELAEAVAGQPYRERLRVAHMRALHRSGRTGEALANFQELRRLLADELGIDPSPAVERVHRAILAGDAAEDPAPVPKAPATNLPAAATGLIGRERAVERIRELLAAGPLVTVTGPGGVGKTSAALAAARAWTRSGPDGAWLVDLGAWDGAGDAADPVLAALAIPEAPGTSASGTERLTGALRERRTLLVLDNCEHVVDKIADLVEALLAATPGVRVLATGREPLRLSRETRFELPPLEVPETDDPDRLAGSAAVRLFLDRSGLEAEPETVASVAEVCRTLDGLPLALELAATRARALGVDELAERLRVPRDRFGVLGSGPRDAPDRQRTLQAVIDWSWRLLGDRERAVLRRLAVHSGGFTLEAAESVCAGPQIEGAAVLDLIAGLVERSLITRVGGRFRLLESVAAFSLERLRESGEETATRERHAAYCLELAERSEPGLRGPDQRAWLRRLDAETANLRAAMETFRGAGDAEGALRLASALTWYWYLRGRLSEARRALASALEVEGATRSAARARAAAWHAGIAIRQSLEGPEAAEEALRGFEPGIERARAEWFLANAVIDFGDEKSTLDLLDHALETFANEGDRWGEAAVLSTRAMLAHMRGDPAALEADAHRAARLFTEAGDDWGVLQATDWLIGLADLTGDRAEAERLSREGLAVAEDLGLWTDVAARLSWLAWIEVQGCDYTAALEHAERARRMCAEQGQRAGEVFATISLAFAAARSGRIDRAREHLRRLLAVGREQQTPEASPPYLSMVLIELGRLAAQEGAASEAMDRYREGFELAHGQGSAAGMARALVGMAEVVASEGDPALAAEILGAAGSADTRTRRSDMERRETDRVEAAVMAAEPDFRRLYARGSALTPERARSLVDEGGPDQRDGVYLGT